ncbi:MAG: CBS domain-containing protein [Planctomycetota bacterium]|jgi:acetoin utilization protein AcuB
MREPYTIGEAMTPAPFAVGADAPLRSARKIMLRERIHHLPVVHRGYPVGLLTDRDLHLVTYLSNDLVSDESLTAADICVPDPYIVGRDTEFSEVTQILARRRLGAAMIIEEGKLVGIFTTHDACRILAEQNAPDYMMVVA